ncbi:MAG: class I SAM-dependent methyltransferase [Pseudomonadota bacterium]
MHARAERATLVFPAVNQAALDYVKAARGRGERVVCAASVANDEVAAVAGELHRLPSIHDADFAARFSALADEHAIGRVLSPVSTVHAFMTRFLAQQRPDLQLIGESPVQQQIAAHRALMARAGRLMPLVELCADGVPTLTVREVAGVLRQASLIYGESNDDKLAAMMGIFARAPQGDVVEIGSLMGRSAFVLLYLAWRHRVGPLLTVDPWAAAECAQRDSPAALQHVTDEWDYEVLSEGFMLNLVPCRADDHAHLRMPSEAGSAVYAGGEPIFSPLGKPVAYSGTIAVIHIDGNHDYAAVKKDCDLWLDRLAPGGWLILDDYVWAHGDGPQRVGDVLLREQSERIEYAFCCGKALFVKLRH